MRRLGKLSIGLLFAALCGCAAPLRNVQGHPLPVDDTPTLEEAEAVIRGGASVKGWLVTKLAAGSLLATLADHQVVVEIRHDATQFDVTYKSSQDLGYDGKGRIHQNYNRWVNTLVQDISGLEIHQVGSARWPE